MPEINKDGLEPRIGQLEGRVSGLEVDIKLMKSQQEALKIQQDRIMSHIESESVAAREDIGKIDRQLFGDRQSVYSGMLGEMRQDLHQMKTWFKTLIATGSTIVFVIGLVYFMAWMLGGLK